MFAAPARLHSCVGGGDVAVEGFRSFGLKVDGETQTRGGRQNRSDEKEPRQL